MPPSRKTKAKTTKAPPISDREKQIEADIKTITATANAAEKARSWSAAVQARAKVTGLREDLARIRDARIASKHVDQIDRVEAQLAMAEREGSWQAVARLSTLRAQLVGALEIREQDEATRATESAEESALVGALLSAIKGLSHEGRNQLRDALDE